jgi:DNA-binding NarL/FixJ family response regulator
MPRVLVVDDHKMIRDSIELLAQTHQSFTVVGQAADGLESIHRASELKPDVILMDIQMPLMNGLEATRHIIRSGLRTNIIALTMINEGDHYLAEMIQAGAMGYLVKSAGMGEIIIAVDMVMFGHRYISSELIPGLIQQVITRPDPTKARPAVPETVLSRRELEVLKLIATGMTNQQIAETLEISARTVENHRHNILSKTNIKNTAALVAIAKEKNWI